MITLFETVLLEFDDSVDDIVNVSREIDHGLYEDMSVEDIKRVIQKLQKFVDDRK